MALEAYLIKPHSYVGLTCTAFQRREAGAAGVRPGGPGQNPSPEPEPLTDQQLRFRCTTGRPSISLSSFHIKVGTGGGTWGQTRLNAGDWWGWEADPEKGFRGGRRRGLEGLRVLRVHRCL